MEKLTKATLPFQVANSSNKKKLNILLVIFTFKNTVTVEFLLQKIALVYFDTPIKNQPQYSQASVNLQLTNKTIGYEQYPMIFTFSQPTLMNTI